MKEHILHLVWKFGLLNQLNCYSTVGEKIEVVHPGVHNQQDSGPDFHTAKIRVGDTLWVGNVEIHVKSSDWYNHLHHFDAAYQNVVLHVVYEDDCGLIEGVKNLPVIELKKCVDQSVWDRILDVEKSKSKIPCAPWQSEISAFEWISWQDRLLTERFERKANDVLLMYKLNQKDWGKVVFQLLAKSLGGTVNKEPFTILSREVPIEVLRKHRSDILAVESILFGVSGMLNDHFKDVYPKALQREYQFYKQKFKLSEMESFWWKWMRLRPSAFPTIQIALLSSLFHNLNQIENLFEIKDFKTFKVKIQKSTVLSPYWENHYKFDKPSKEKVKNWGEDLIKRIYINAVLPYQIARKLERKEELNEIISEFLFQLKAEDNKVTRYWFELGLPMKTAYESQAFLQLYNEYCSQKKCLNCNIGLKVLKRAKYDQVS